MARYLVMFRTKRETRTESQGLWFYVASQNGEKVVLYEDLRMAEAVSEALVHVGFTDQAAVFNANTQSLVTEVIKGQEAREERRRQTKKEREAAQIAAIRNHDCKKSGCGPICTFGDW